MASNDYPYYSSSGAYHQYAGQTTGTTGGNPYDSYSPQPSQTTLPPYSSNSRLEQPPRNQTVSPFESVFDDHVYPLDARSGAPDRRASNFANDPRYYGAGPSTPSETPYSNMPEDIPLQDRNAKDNRMETPDHVYDLAETGQVPKREKKKRGKVRFGELGMLGANNKKRIPWVVYILTFVQSAVFIGEIVKNATTTGSPIMTQPSFNPMIGPSPYVLINMGARFVPCMHNVQGVQSSTVNISWPCPWTTTNDETADSNHCTLSELCGFGGVPEPDYNGNMNQEPEPNQWFRFIVPIFLHAGLVHIGFNLLLQMTIGREMEIAIGPIRFFLVYFSSGIFGFVMGGNYAATGIQSTGASGSLFGIIALTLLDLLYSWKERRSPLKDLAFIVLDVVISFVLGLLPGLDNFSHIGGFIMGIALGICVLHSPNALRRRIGEESFSGPPYSSLNPNGDPASAPQANDGPPSFFKSPVGFFKGRKPLWWVWWLIRAGALIAVIVVFILLLNNFYIYHNTCSWCRYLSCLPVNNWCNVGNLQITNTTSKRDVFEPVFRQVARLNLA